MPYQLGGDSGGLIGLIEGEVAEQYGLYTGLTTSVSTQATQIATNSANNTANATALTVSGPKYLIMSCNTTAIGAIGFDSPFSELGGYLSISSSGGGSLFTHVATSPSIYLFTMNIPWGLGQSVYNCFMKHTPNGQAEYDYFIHQRYFTSNTTTNVASPFAVTIKLQTGDTIKFTTDKATLNTLAWGRMQVTRLG